MPSFLTDKPRLVLFDFLAKRIGITYSTDFEGLGRVVEGKLVGVIGFNHFNGASCHVHMAGDPGWMTRGMLETVARYAFILRGCNMMFGLIPSGNTAALDQDLRLGFKNLMTIPDAHPDGSLHLLQMTKAECRWLTRKRYGQEVYTNAA